jgi:hypothetical protein
MATMPDTSPTALESRARWLLQHHLAQDFSFRTVSALLAIERGDAAVNSVDASRLLHAATQAVVTAEILAGREARP